MSKIKIYITFFLLFLLFFIITMIPVSAEELPILHLDSTNVNFTHNSLTKTVKYTINNQGNPDGGIYNYNINVTGDFLTDSHNLNSKINLNKNYDNTSKKITLSVPQTIEGSINISVDRILKAGNYAGNLTVNMDNVEIINTITFDYNKNFFDISTIRGYYGGGSYGRINSEDSVTVITPSGVDGYTISGVSSASQIDIEENKNKLYEIEPNSIYMVSFDTAGTGKINSNNSSLYNLYDKDGNNLLLAPMSKFTPGDKNVRTYIYTNAQTKYIAIRFGCQGEALDEITYSNIKLTKVEKKEITHNTAIGSIIPSIETDIEEVFEGFKDGDGNIINEESIVSKDAIYTASYKQTEYIDGVYARLFDTNSDGTGDTLVLGKTPYFTYEGTLIDRFNNVNINDINKISYGELPWSKYRNVITKVEIINDAIPNSVAHYFEQMKNVTEFKNLSNFNMSNCTSLRNMFVNSTVTSLDITGWNTINVTDMHGLFAHMPNLKELKQDLITSNVKDMSWMFEEVGVETLDLSNFNTSKVTDMSSMLRNMHNIKTLDLSSFNTSNVKTMRSMFIAVASDGATPTSSNLEKIIFGNNFNTSNVTDMAYMFTNLQYLASLDVSNFNTANVTTMDHMFAVLPNVKTLDVSNFDTSKVTSMFSMFASLDLSTSEVIPSQLTEIKFGEKFNTKNVKTMRTMFAGQQLIRELDLTSFYSDSLTDVWHIFNSTSNLETVYTSNRFTLPSDTTTNTICFDTNSPVVTNNKLVNTGDCSYGHIYTEDNPGLFTYKNSDYIQVQNISFDSTNYMNTGLHASDGIKIKTRYKTNQATGAAIFGSVKMKLNNESAEEGFRFFNHMERFYLDYGLGSQTEYRLIGEENSALNNISHDIEFGNNYIKNLETDTVVATGSNVNPFDYPLIPISLFGSEEAIGDLYSMKIYKEDILVRDYIPVKDKNNNYCLYDLVNENCTYHESIWENVKGTSVFLSKWGPERYWNDKYGYNSLHRFSIEGNTKQQQTSGKNLFNINSANNTLLALVDKNDIIQLGLDRTKESSVGYVNYFTDNLNLKPNTYYNVVLEVKENRGNSNNYLWITSNHPDSSWGQFEPYNIQLKNLPSYGTKIFKIKTKTDMTGNVGLRTFLRVEAGTSSLIRLRISVLEYDENLTADNFVYEPYTNEKSSPSPDNKQSIKNITGNVQFLIRGKNLFDGEWNNLGQVDNSGYNTLENANKIYVKPNTNYIISNNGIGRAVVLREYGENDEELSNHRVDANSSFITNNKTVYIKVSMYESNTEKFQIEQGTKITAYEAPYKKTYDLNLGNIELNRIGDYYDYIYKKDNNWFIHKEIGSHVFSLDDEFTYLADGEGEAQGVKRFKYYNSAIRDVPSNVLGCFNESYKCVEYDSGTSKNNRTINSASAFWGQNIMVFTTDSTTMTVDEFKEKINGSKTYYLLKSPTDTQITDTNLISQLNEIDKGIMYPYATITTITENEVLPILDLSYFTP